MRLTHVISVHVHRVSARLVRPFVTAVRRADSAEFVIAELCDSEGRCGWGEAPTSWRVTGESFQSVRAVIEDVLGPSIEGMPTNDPEAISIAIERAVVGNSAARMALDCAAYDLAAQQAGLPLWRYLSGTRGEVRTDMTLSASTDTAELVQAALEHCGAGFTALKLKVAAGADTAGQLAAVREAVGPGVALRVDANQAWGVDQAVRVIVDLAERGLGVEFVEQPTAREDVRGLVDVARRVNVPLMADESVWTRRQLLELLAVGRVDFLNIKLAKTGGLREALALAELARAHGVAIVVGCMLESHVGISAAASFAAAISGGAPAVHDLDGGVWFAESPVAGGARYEGPRIVLCDAPGLGITGLR
jgi:L-Ala-D/L-Glu epimerase